MVEAGCSVALGHLKTCFTRKIQREEKVRVKLKPLPQGDLEDLGQRNLNGQKLP